MPTHAEKRLLHHTPEQLFDLVADVDKYPEFLPWCIGTRVKEPAQEEGNDVILADMVIGYKIFRETFSSKVICQKPDRIDVTYFDGPFSMAFGSNFRFRHRFRWVKSYLFSHLSSCTTTRTQ